jgi:hypothetical protein
MESENDSGGAGGGGKEESSDGKGPAYFEGKGSFVCNKKDEVRGKKKGKMKSK